MTVPQSTLLSSLVERALQLLAESLGVLPALVLGHPEQHGGGVRGYKDRIRTRSRRKL